MLVAWLQSESQLLQLDAKMNIENYLVQCSGSTDEVDILSRRLFDVNIRLYQNNQEYRELVRAALQHLVTALNTEYDNYTPPVGMSGANIGVPWNIIAVPRLMINPKIIDHSFAYEYVKSNCGSIQLPQTISVKRWKFIDVEYYNIEGKLVVEYDVDRCDGGYTIQHEIDHNQGKLISHE